MNYDTSTDKVCNPVRYTEVITTWNPKGYGTDYAPLGNACFLGIRLLILKGATNVSGPYVRLPVRDSEKKTAEYKSDVLPLR